MTDSSNSAEQSTSDEPSFEESFAEIQSIVEALEEGAVGLEESMQRFERGTTLLRKCYRLLEEAEQRIEILTGRDADGGLAVEPFDASATHEAGAPQAGRRRKKKATAKKAKPSAEDPGEGEDTLF